MKFIRVLVAAAAFSVASAPVFAQTGQTAAAPAQAASQNPPQEKPKTPTYEETIVVSASKTEQKIVDAPATVTVFTPKFLENSPASNYGDLLRGVPGLNVTQLSARDINITSRAATSSLSTTQLAILDGRTLYQDFFGFIMWDFMPANMSEIKQIEVVRGPASAVWGANAMNGVVNIVTKSPREMNGGNVNVGVGTFSRDVNGNGASAGNLFYINGVVGGAINDKWAYKASGGVYSSDPLARPTGFLPNATNTPYPSFVNEGTVQPKGALRLDRDWADGRRLTLEGGVGATTGIMESGLGPFKINSGTTMSFGKVSYTKGAAHVQAFLNALNGEAPNLLSTDQAGSAINFKFVTKTFDVEAGDSHAFGKNVVTYGGNLRANRFHLTLAPGETSRTEGGGYVQDELFVNDHVRLVAGARVDKFTSIDNPVFSPRVALVLKPRNDQTFRVSYNRAFRAPSMINNDLDVTIGTPLPLAAVNKAINLPLFPATANFYVPTRATGNPDLTEEHIDAFELSYTGKVGAKSLFSAAFYVNKTSNEIFFTVSSLYGNTAPPAGWTSLPQWAALGPLAVPTAVAVWSGVQSQAHFPSGYTYKNLGEVKNKGIELGWDSTPTDQVSYYLNYSFQSDPVPTFPGLTADQAFDEINRPAKNRFNAGITVTGGRFFGTFGLSFVDDAFWQDVLDDRYHGATPDYTTCDVVAGARFHKNNATLQLRVNNIGNVAVQQHIFGDVIRRQFVAELKLNVPKK